MADRKKRKWDVPGGDAISPEGMMIGPNGPMYAGGGLGPRHHTGLGMAPPAGAPPVVTANAMAAAKAGAAGVGGES